MLVTRHMTWTPVTLRPDVSIMEASDILAARSFRHLPVVDGEGRLQGIVTDRDLRSAMPSSVADPAESQIARQRLDNTPVSLIMSTPKVWLTESSTLDDALLFFVRDGIGALPVLDGKKRIIGIFSIRDLLAAYKHLFGLDEKGSALITVSGNTDLPLSRLMEALEENKIFFSRLLLSGDQEKGRFIHVRVHTFNVAAVHDILTEAGFMLVPNPG